MPLTRQKYPALNRFALEGIVNGASGDFLSSLLSAFSNIRELHLNLQTEGFSQLPLLSIDNPLPHLQRAYLVRSPALAFDRETLICKLPSLKFLTVRGDDVLSFHVMMQVESVCLTRDEDYRELPQRFTQLDATFPYLRSLQLHLFMTPSGGDPPFPFLHNLTCLKLKFLNSAERIPGILAACPDVVELSLRLPVESPYFSSETFVSVIPPELRVCLM